MAEPAEPAAVPVARRRRLLTAALAGYALGCLTALFAWGLAEAQRQAAAREAFGTRMAQDVAHLAVDSLMRQDRIGLGLLAGRFADRPQVRAIAVHTVDRRPFVVVGEAATPGSPAFRADVAVEDSVVGSVRVTLNANAFGLSLGGLLAQSWWCWPIGLLFAAGGALLAGRRWPAAKPDDAAAETPPESAAPKSVGAQAPAGTAAPGADGPLVLVANLFSRARLTATERDQALRRCQAVAAAVSERLDGEVAALDHSGVSVTFPGDGEDAAYQALRAALLLRAALAKSGSAPWFRHGLDRAPAAAVARLAALAADGELLLGTAAYASLQQPERLRLAVADPTLRMLSPTAEPSHLVRGVCPEQEQELAAEAAAIAAACR